MSGRSSEKKEIIQWGYAALVFIALGFGSITGATANTMLTDLRPSYSEIGNKGACLLPPGIGEKTDKQSCDRAISAATEATYTLNSILNSPWMNNQPGSNYTKYPSRGEPSY